MIIVVPPDSADARAGEKVLDRHRAHEGHFEMGVRIDAARHHVAAGSVEDVIRRNVELFADRDDFSVLDENVGLVRDVGGDHRTALDEFGHSCFPAVQTDRKAMPEIMAF